MDKQTMILRNCMKQALLFHLDDKEYSMKEIKNLFETAPFLKNLNSIYRNRQSSRYGWSITDFDRMDKLLNNMRKEGTLIRTSPDKRIYKLAKPQKYKPSEILEFQNSIQELLATL